MLPLMARIVISSDVVPGPSIEAPFLDVGDVIRRQIVPELVAFVDGSPQLAGLRVNRNAHRIADAARINAKTGSIGICLENIGAVVLARIVVHVIDVRTRANRDEQLPSIEGKRDVSRPVPPAL